jgi:hypothetical protein
MRIKNTHNLLLKLCRNLHDHTLFDNLACFNKSGGDRYDGQGRGKIVRIGTCEPGNGYPGMFFINQENILWFIRELGMPGWGTHVVIGIIVSLIFTSVIYDFVKIPGDAEYLGIFITFFGSIMPYHLEPAINWMHRNDLL